MLNYHIVNIKHQVFHLAEFIPLQDTWENLLSHKIFINFFFCFYWVDFKWSKNIVKETTIEHKDFEKRTCSSPTSHKVRGKVMWLIHQFIQQIWFVINFMLSTIQIALDIAGKEDRQVLFSHAANIFSGGWQTINKDK